jgi:hypothetical protein
MALTSASTTRAWQQQLEDASDYDLVGSLEKVRLFIQAVRVLLRRVPDQITHGGTMADGYQNSPAKLQRMLDDATAWWRANDPNALSSSGGGGMVTLQTSPDFRR